MTTILVLFALFTTGPSYSITSFPSPVACEEGAKVMRVSLDRMPGLKSYAWACLTPAPVPAAPPQEMRG